MKTSAATVLFIILFSSAFSQTTIPSYSTVVKDFFSKYKGTEDNDDYTSFSKKKNGWYVQQVNRYKNDSLLSEQLYFSLAENKFLDISAKYERSEGLDKEKNISLFLSDSYLLYGFSRCRYFGYSEWNEDMIKDFGEEKNLGDTLLEGLARAYTSYAGTYMWYQWGDNQLTTDTLQRKLGRTEIPSDERLKKVEYYINRSIDTYARLEKQSPNHLMLVGNPFMKVFNECLNGYMQMSLSQNDSLANHFMNRASLSTPYIQQAKNYLNSCDSNAILFTYGDNDTYPLWYVQQILGFRKDIEVINTSMLGFAPYIDVIKKKKNILVNTPFRFYNEATAEVCYFVKSEAYKNPGVRAFEELETMLYTKQFPYISELEGTPNYSTYPVKDFYIQLNPAATFNERKMQFSECKLEVRLGNVLFMNDLLMLDIVNANNLKRPIYFTLKPMSFFDENILQQGICYKLLPNEIVANKQMQAIEISSLENFASTIFHPVASNKDIFSEDGDNNIVQLYCKISAHYAEKGNLELAKKWYHAAASKLEPEKYLTLNSLKNLIAACLAAREVEESKYLFELCANKTVDTYFNPSALNLYTLKEYCLEYLNQIRKTFIAEKMETAAIDSYIKKFKNN